MAEVTRRELADHGWDLSVYSFCKAMDAAEDIKKEIGGFHFSTPPVAWLTVNLDGYHAAHLIARAARCEVEINESLDTDEWIYTEHICDRTGGEYKYHRIEIHSDGA